MNNSKARRMNEAVGQLIVDRKFSVARKGKDLLLVKMVARRPISIFLRHTDDGFWIEPPKQEFICSCSHFEFSDTEQRYTRRKNVLLQLVTILQKTKMWDHILNKTFFVPNKHNPKMNKKIVGDQYRSVMGEVNIK